MLGHSEKPNKGSKEDAGGGSCAPRLARRRRLDAPLVNQRTEKGSQGAKQSLHYSGDRGAWKGKRSDIEKKSSRKMGNRHGVKKGTS